MRPHIVLVSFVLFLVLLVGLVVTCSSREEAKKQVKEEPPKKETTSQKAAEGSAAQDTAAADEVAILETNYGTIVLEFFPEDAPGHVENFKKLARKGFYDGTKFHRVIKGFMIQGGDPLSKDDNPDNDGTGGPGYRIKAEFNDRKHLKGTLSMARGADVNSAGSQFFICLAPQPSLDGKYTVFGQVLEGLDVVEAIGNVRVKASRIGETSVPVEPVIAKKVKILPREEFLKAKKSKPEEETKKKKAEPEEGTNE